MNYYMEVSGNAGGVSGVSGYSGANGVSGQSGFSGAGLSGFSGFSGAGAGRDLAILSATVSSARENNWSPAGWPGTDIKVIHISSTSPNGMMCISGLAETSAGRMVTLKNVSADNLIILEKNSTLSSASNRFYFYGRGGYFLFPGESVTVLHDGDQWTQFSGHPNCGHELLDDFLSPNQNSATTAALLCGWGSASGTGALIRNENGGLPGQQFGSIGLSTGTLATGQCEIKSQARSRSASFYYTGEPFKHVALVIRFRLGVGPTAAQDYQCIWGLNESALTGTQSLVGFNGWKCQNSTGANWTTYVSNQTGTVISEVTSTLPANDSAVILGVYCPTNVGDFVFFYSTDGVTYTFERRFTRTSLNYGGTPHLGIRKLAGTTSVTLQADYIALSVRAGTL